jgi:hypothetical protein
VSGSLLVGYIAYDHQKQVIAQKEADEWYEKEIAPKTTEREEVIQVGAIEQTVYDMQKNQIFTLKEIADNLTRNIGKEFPPSNVYRTIAQGCIVVYMDNHQYYFQSKDENDKGYILMTYNDDETIIEKVKYNQTIYKP